MGTLSKRFLAAQNFLLVAAVLLAFSLGRVFARELNEEQDLYDSKGKRDPFVPLVRDGRIVDVGSGSLAPGSSSTLMLAGVVWDPGGRSIALINDTEVMVGDTIGEYKVAEIRRDSVVLVRNGESVVLRMMFEQSGQSPGLQRGGERQ